MNHQETLTGYITAFVDELTRTGITDAVISPGSRSTPLAYIMAEHPDMNIHINIDERSAAFFALGMAKEKRKPVALLCTSGTAAANYFPAVVEAYYSRVPLIVLTADRPHELRDVGAPQAIDQLQLYGKHAKWFMEMSLPELNEGALQYVRTVASRAAGTASLNPAGPVHINFPLREPLIPDLNSMNKWIEKTDQSKAQIDISRGELYLSTEQLAGSLSLIEKASKGIIICGPMDQPDIKEAIIEFAEYTGFPILADPLSQLRSGTGSNNLIIEGYDSFLKEDDLQDILTPDLIIRFGAMPVSKPLLLFLKKIKSVPLIVVDGGGGWREPAGIVSHMIYCNEAIFCRNITANLEKQVDHSWGAIWSEVNQATKKGLAAIKNEKVLQEGKLFAILTDALPASANLMVGNSMPIRNVDTFFHKTDKDIRILANRGANGIDGIVSTALGITASSDKPTILALGDLSFYHDMNGLLAARMHGLKPLILLINNDGGGIFSYLPQSKEEKHFETLFGTPHGLQFRETASLYGALYRKPANWEEVSQFIEEWITSPEFTIMEIETNRAYDVNKYREVLKNVSREIKRFHYDA